MFEQATGCTQNSGDALATASDVCCVRKLFESKPKTKLNLTCEATDKNRAVCRNSLQQPACTSGKIGACKKSIARAQAEAKVLEVADGELKASKSPFFCRPIASICWHLIASVANYCALSVAAAFFFSKNWSADIIDYFARLVSRIFELWTRAARILSVARKSRI